MGAVVDSPTATTRSWAARIPHALTISRVILVAVTYYAALHGDKPLFAVLVLLAVLTDILDGPIARALGTADRFGANMDSAADLLFYASLPVWAYLFDAELVVQSLPLIVALGSLYVIANFVSHATFGALGVHNRLSRASGTAGVVFTFYSILWGIEPILRDILLIILVADLAQRYGAVAAHFIRRRRAGL
jgi:phosphatidylglycerophosphate synthase